MNSTYLFKNECKKKLWFLAKKSLEVRNSKQSSCLDSQLKTDTHSIIYFPVQKQSS